MSNNKILKNNKFANCTRSELLSLWHGLEQVYAEGWSANDNPLTPYKNAYCEESNMGLILVEQDLLRLEQLLVNFVVKEVCFMKVYDILRYGTVLTDNELYDHYYPMDKYVRIRIIAYNGIIYYHKMINGEVVEFKKVGVVE